MIRSHVVRGLTVALGLAIAATAVTASAAVAGPLPAAGPTIGVTQADVDATNRKIGMAYGALVSMWTTEFKRIGSRFAAPRIARYDRSVMTACGVIQSNNAEYCARNNTIFYDEVFVAGMGKRAAMSLGTDGDMAAVGIIAHEMGHAVAIELGREFRTSYESESTADCLAGAFAEQSGRDGSLEKGDIEEAFFGMSLSGDPTPRPTGNERVDALIHARIARESHGTREQRTENFRAGLSGGPRACLAEFGA